MHILIARGLGHLVVIPIGGLLAMTWAHIDFAWMVGIDVIAVVLLEMALVGGPIPLALGAKSIIPAVAGAWALPRILPRPTTTAVVVSSAVVAAAMAGVVWYLIRARRHPLRDSQWHRTIASLTCLTLAATLEMSAAGLALTMGGLEPAHITAVFASVPLWLAAFHLQTSPRRGESRARRIIAVAHRVWDQHVSGRIGFAAGVR